MRLTKLLKSGFLASSFLIGISQAQIPNLIAYQGILTDNGGNPFPDAAGYPITFTIYDDSLQSGTHQIWTETQNIAIKNGMFGTMLGSVAPLSSLAFDKQYYLGVTRNGTELKPRLRLLSSPYSLRAAIADSASKADTSKFAKTAGIALSKNASAISSKSIDSAKIADSSVTSSKIRDGSILSQDVNSSFKAPRTTIADSAICIPASAIINGMIDNSKLSDSSITSSKIKNGTIQSEDVNSNFKAPLAIFSDSSLFADSARYVNPDNFSAVYQSKQQTKNVGGDVTAGKYYKLVTGCGNYGKVRIYINTYNYEIHNIVEWINDYSMVGRGAMKIDVGFTMDNGTIMNDGSNGGMFDQYVLDTNNDLWGRARTTTTKGSIGLLTIIDGLGNIASMSEGIPSSSVSTISW